MSELLQKLGIDWKLLSAQAVNFFLILIVLRLTIYKPLIQILKERKHKIQKGMEDAEEARRHLTEVEAKGRERIAEVEKESIMMLTKAETRAKEEEAEMMRVAKTKQDEMIKGAERAAETKTREAEEIFYRNAVEVVRAAVAKTARLSPSVIDASLVEEGLNAVKKHAK